MRRDGTFNYRYSVQYILIRRSSELPVEDPVSRLEQENHQLRRQLELVGRSGPDIDTKFSTLASEVVRLQTSVNQVIQGSLYSYFILGLY